MVKNKIMIPNKTIILSVFVFLVGCANQLPPGGGDVDLIPPKIISTYPPNGSINFDENTIEFEFSEYVDKRSFRDAIFISPSIDKQPEISWSGQSVELTFPEGLQDDKTYVVTIGTDVVDVNNKNRMANSFSFSFATGEIIDTRTISGKVYGKDIDGTLFFAYKLFDADTSKYLNKKPDYISQAGKDGNYKLSGLAESKYRVFAVKDELRDLLYQADQDLIGIPNTDVSLVEYDSNYVGLNFSITKIDTVKPRLISAAMTDRNHIIVTLSEVCDSTTFNAANFSIVDSSSQKILPVGYLYRNNSKQEEFVLSFTDSINTENIYYLSAKILTDVSGNIFENDFSSLTTTDKLDTSSIKVVRTNLGPKNEIDFQNPELIVYFDDAIANKEITNAVQLEDTSKNKVPFNLKFMDDATVKIKPLKDFKPEKHYVLKIDLSKFTDASGNSNKKDTLQITKFSTINGVEFTGVSGKVKSSKENIVVVLQDVSDQTKYFTAIPDNTATYSVERINAGLYSLWYFVDTNNNKVFDKGYPEPFKFAEEFGIVKDTLKLRPRWSVTDFDINIK